MDPRDRFLSGAVRFGLVVDLGDGVADSREVDARDRFLSGAVRFGLGVDLGDAVADSREVDARDRFLAGAVRLGLGLEDALSGFRSDERVVFSTAALERAVWFLLSPPLASKLRTRFNRSILSLLRLCLLLATVSLEVTSPTSARGRGGAAVDSEFLRLLRGSRVNDLADSPSATLASGARCWRPFRLCELRAGRREGGVVSPATLSAGSLRWLAGALSSEGWLDSGVGVFGPFSVSVGLLGVSVVAMSSRAPRRRRGLTAAVWSVVSAGVAVRSGRVRPGCPRRRPLGVLRLLAVCPFVGRLERPSASSSRRRLASALF